MPRMSDVSQWVVTYHGFLQSVSRLFPSKERAEQWARQVGKFREATITEVSNAENV